MTLLRKGGVMAKDEKPVYHCSVCDCRLLRVMWSRTGWTHDTNDPIWSKNLYGWKMECTGRAVPKEMVK
jgi:hypothetical protein